MHPPRMSAPSCIVPPTEQLVIRPHIVPLLPTFHGMESENPYAHIKEFEDICNTFREEGASIDLMRLKLFPFTLKDKAKIWLNSLRPRSIRTWTDLQAEFLKKFFPTQRTNSLKRQISNFSAKENEKFYECWERYMEAINACPHHGFDTWLLVSYFYDGMSSSMKQLLKTMCGGDFMSKNPEEAMDFLSYVAEVSRGWDEPHRGEVGKMKSQPNALHAKARMYTLNEDVDMKAKFAAMTRRVEELELKKMHEVQTVAETPVQVRDVKALITLRSGKKVESPTPKLYVEEKEEEETKKREEMKGKKKDISEGKRTKAFLTEQGSAIIQCKSPLKYKDPGCPTISVMIRGKVVEKALLDLGASVNLLPYSVYKQLGLGELKPTSITLSLADRSVKIPRGIIKDVLVQVDKFYYPIDFVVLDTNPLVKEANYVPIILGRPFLATSNAIINCRNGLMQLTFGNMTLELNIFHMSKKLITPEEEEGLEEVCIIDTLVEEHCDQNMQDELNESLEDLEEGLSEPADVLATLQGWRRKEEILPLFNKEEGQDDITEEFPKLNLKPLPLERFLLLEVLKRCKKAIGWQISDLKGINPLVCTHHIYMEKEAKPIRQPQRRLNPHLQEVVRTEVLKLLQAGIIYPISDSPWVSPTQVVPKKSGITVVQNEKGEEIATRLTSGAEESLWPSFLLFLGRNNVFGLCNAPATFQRCMLSIFIDMVERIMEVFMDDITIYGGIVLGHIIFEKDIEVDKAKVELIAKLPSPTTIKRVRQFLGHAGFHRRFIQDFSKLSRPLCELLTKDANDFAIGAVLGQREDGKPYVIYYVSKTLNEAQRNYTTTEKELLVVVFALDKFCAYLVRSFIIVFTDHSALKDKKVVENVVADHLSRLAIAHNSHVLPINDDFPEESLMLLEKAPWYAHIANYLVTGEVPREWKAQDMKHFFAKIHAYYWEEPFLFKYCADQIIRKCVLKKSNKGSSTIAMRMPVEATLPLRKQP
ncbi:Retrovirus-related Pol polyprotein from transposon opus [Vitis vinifera]|uniref:RNA-directed DNA polymerase n=1 Tax=Vitis vinifera TaxID=29760 RepID=A0A438CBA0_VITVI|nr:Retrovirus-related Pol polyprotein from transposon opus [Vitis vinifera]